MKKITGTGGLWAALLLGAACIPIGDTPTTEQPSLERRSTAAEPTAAVLLPDLLSPPAAHEAPQKQTATGPTTTGTGATQAAPSNPTTTRETIRIVGSLRESVAAKDVAAIDAAVRARLDAHAHLVDGSVLTLLRQGGELKGIRIERASTATFFAVALRGAAGERAWFDARGQRTDEGEWLARPLELARVTSRFGARLHPLSGRQSTHHGVDYGAPRGTPVLAVADGVVVAAGEAGTAGNRVELRHRGRTSLYLHLDRIADRARKGAELHQGDVLGWVGTTGASTGPHLHFEVRIGSIALDPLTLLPSSGSPCPLARRAELDALIDQLRDLAQRQ